MGVRKLSVTVPPKGFSQLMTPFLVSGTVVDHVTLVITQRSVERPSTPSRKS